MALCSFTIHVIATVILSLLLKILHLIMLVVIFLAFRPLKLRQFLLEVPVGTHFDCLSLSNNGVRLISA